MVSSRHRNFRAMRSLGLVWVWEWACRLLRWLCLVLGWGVWGVRSCMARLVRRFWKASDALDRLNECIHEVPVSRPSLR